ncbi:MAG: hypothetical protein ACOCXH_07745 [Cyclobacteriaceae bacterium]
MKTIKILSIAAMIVVFFGCNSSQQDTNATAEADNETTTEQVNDRDAEANKEEQEVITTKAKFQYMIANTAGTSYVFKTPEVDELQLFPGENLKGMEFANSLQPGNTDHEYYGKEFEIKYVERPTETPGGMVDRKFLLEVK